jgi:hypothetical protein
MIGKIEGNVESPAGIGLRFLTQAETPIPYGEWALVLKWILP